MTRKNDRQNLINSVYYFDNWHRRSGPIIASQRLLDRAVFQYLDSNQGI